MVGRLCNESRERGAHSNWLIDDYWISLEKRELIHDIGCDDQIQEADERFRAMLIATHIKHRYKERDSDYDFGTMAIRRTQRDSFTNR